MSDAQQRLDARPTVPFDQVIGRFAADVNGQWWRTKLLVSGASDQHPVALHTGKLGNPDFHWTHEEVEYAVWDRPDYRIFVNDNLGVSLQVPKDTRGALVTECIEAYAEDMGVFENPLTLAEKRAAREQGRLAAVGHEYEVPRASAEDLRKFVLGYVDRQVWTDRDIEPSCVGMVFMPLMFGACSPQGPDAEKGTEGDAAWHALQTLPQLTTKPTPPMKPSAPALPERPTKPDVEPSDLEALILTLQHERDSLTWVLNPDNEAIAEIEIRIREKIAELATIRRDAHKALELTIQRWEAECERLKQEHEQAIQQWEETCRTVEAGLSEWERQKALAEAAHAGFMQQYARNIGVVYEWTSQAGPRAINGYPMFMSCRLLHAEDWARAQTAILREAKRREEFEV